MEGISIKKDWMDKLSFLMNTITFFIVCCFGLYLSVQQFLDYRSLAELNVQFQTKSQDLGQLKTGNFTNFITSSIYVNNVGNRDVDNWKIMIYFHRNVKVKNFNKNWEQLPPEEIFGQNAVSSTMFQYLGDRELLAELARNSYIYTGTEFDRNFLGNFEFSFLNQYFDENGSPKVYIATILSSGKRTVKKAVDVYFDYAVNHFIYDTKIIN